MRHHGLNMNKAVFLDKDGTIINNIPYNIKLEKITILPSTIDGLRLLLKNGYQLIIVTNQSGVAKGYFSEQDFLQHLHAILDLFLQQGIFISSYYYCPHNRFYTPQGLVKTCFCGKPNPGMLLKAANDFSIDLSASWMIGDILNDVEAGKRANTHTILLNVGNETEWQGGDLRNPDFVSNNLLDAARIILHARKDNHESFTL